MGDDENKLEQTLKDAIEASGMSRYAISKATGIGQPTLSRFMAGEHSLSLGAADKLLRLFNLEVRAVRPKRKGN